MSAYVTMTIEEMNDPAAMQEYGAHAPAVVQSYGGEFLIAQSPAVTLEGGWTPGAVTLIAFPSTERALEFYESADYRPWRQLRESAARTSIVLIQG